MDIPNHVLLYLLLIAGAQGIALAVTIYLHSVRTLHSTFFALFVLLISLGSLEKSIGGLFLEFPDNWLIFPLANPLSYYPAIYLHFLFLSSKMLYCRPGMWFHFAPAFVLDFLSFYYLDWPGNPAPFLALPGLTPARFDDFYTVAFILHFIAYSAAIIRLHRGLPESPSPRNVAITQWFNRLKPILFVFWTSWIVVKLIGKQNPLGYSVSFLIHGSIILFIYGLGYSYVLKMRGRFDSSARQMAASRGDFDASAVVEQIRKSGIHLSPQVTLATASKQLSLPQNTISSAINFSEGLNFSDFINELRIEDFKGRIQCANSGQLSLFGNAQEVGFSSKSSFYRAFKKRTGQTPGEYLSHLDSK